MKVDMVSKLAINQAEQEEENNEKARREVEETESFSCKGQSVNAMSKDYMPPDSKKGIGLQISDHAECRFHTHLLFDNQLKR